MTTIRSTSAYSTWLTVNIHCRFAEVKKIKRDKPDKVIDRIKNILVIHIIRFIPIEVPGEAPLCGLCGEKKRVPVIK